MNLALSAVLLFLILTPGIAFRTTFLKSDSLRSTLSSTPVGEFLFILLLSFLAHSVGVYLASFCWPIRIDQVYYLLVNSEYLDLDLLQASFPWAFPYFAVLTVIWGWLGKLVQNQVVKFNLDKRFPFLSVSNDWEKLFSGRTLRHDLRNKLDFIQVDVLTEVEGRSVLYCGLLEKFTFDNDQQLDKIYISSVYRRKFDEDRDEEASEEVGKEEPKADQGEGSLRSKNVLDTKSSDDRYYKMPGSYLIIPYRRMTNLNITYLTLQHEAMPSDSN